ncbi:MAG: asparaginase [Pseudomonadota bacterium]
MTDAAPNPVLAVRSRADYVERVHRGRVAVVDGAGALVAALGDVETPFLPRSSCKIVQALPLVESGAAEGLDPRRLALACASHQGSAAHAGAAAAWLAEMGLSEADLMCGPQVPNDGATRHALREAGEAPSQLHNNCSGKHAGFLRLAQALGAPTADYVDPDHPAQRAVRAATAELAEEEPAGHAVDGCSAPNHAISLAGLARSMARFAAAETALSGARRNAAIRLRRAMAAHPFEVAGTGRACTELIEAGGGRFVVKTGAEGSFTAILPERGLGVALKIDDGDRTAAECAMTAILVGLGALDAGDPRVAARLAPEEVNRRGIVCGGGAPGESLRTLTLD